MDVNEAPPKDDEWFTEHIIVQGDTITINVNGKQLVKWTQPADWNGGREGPGARSRTRDDCAASARPEQHRVLQEHPGQAARRSASPRSRTRGTWRAGWAGRPGPGLRLARGSARSAPCAAALCARGDHGGTARRRYPGGGARERAVHQGRQRRLGNDDRSARARRLSLRLRRQWRRRDRSAQHRDQRIEHNVLERGDGARLGCHGRQERAARRRRGRHYHSSALGRTRRMHVYTPPGYEIGQATSIRSSTCSMAPATATTRGRRSAAPTSSSTT